MQCSVTKYTLIVYTPVMYFYVNLISKTIVKVCFYMMFVISNNYISYNCLIFFNLMIKLMPPSLSTLILIIFNMELTQLASEASKYNVNFNLKNINIFYPVGMEHLIALLTPQCFQIPLTPRMFSVWDFVAGIFARKALLNMGTFNPQLLVSI